MGPGCQPHKTRSVWFLPLFLPLISGYSTLTSHLCRPVNAEGRCMQMGPGCQPHKREAYDCVHYILPLISAYSTLTSHLCRPVNAEGCCRPMDPRCQPLYKRIVWFLGLFFTRDIAATWLYFWYLSLNIAAGWWVSNVILTIQETLDILIIFYPWYCWLLAFNFNPSPLNIAAGWWAPEFSLSVQERCDILIIFYPDIAGYLPFFRSLR